MKENSNDLISVIVPIYNFELYLEECVESIINQTYRRLEIILVNDGSTDNSGKIADKCASKDNRIKVIHKVNGGVSSARNEGIKASTGKYICFADADDRLMPDYVEYMVSMCQRYDCQIALTKNMFTTFDKKQVKKDKEIVVDGRQGNIEILSYNMPIGVYCKMFERDFLLKNNICFEKEIFIGEGFNFNTYALQRADKVAIGLKKIYFYRRDNEASATTRFSEKKWRNAIFAIENIEKNLIYNDSKTRRALRYAMWHTYEDAYNFIVIANSQKQSSEFYKECKKNVKTRAFSVFGVKISMKERIRGIICMFIPSIIPFLIVRRRKKIGGKGKI